MNIFDIRNFTRGCENKIYMFNRYIRGTWEDYYKYDFQEFNIDFIIKIMRM